jgi:hypothetical protein
MRVSLGGNLKRREMANAEDLVPAWYTLPEPTLAASGLAQWLLGAQVFMES